MAGSASREFQDQLVDFLPRMRTWALALTRSASAAEDLVQEVALKTLMASKSFIPGTNFSAWTRRIMVNQFITNIRRQRGSTISTKCLRSHYLRCSRTTPSFGS